KLRPIPARTPRRSTSRRLRMPARNSAHPNSPKAGWAIARAPVKEGGKPAILSLTDCGPQVKSRAWALRPQRLLRADRMRALIFVQLQNEVGPEPLRVEPGDPHNLLIAVNVVKPQVILQHRPGHFVLLSHSHDVSHRDQVPDDPRLGEVVLAEG